MTISYMFYILSQARISELQEALAKFQAVQMRPLSLDTIADLCFEVADRMDGETSYSLVSFRRR